MAGNHAPHIAWIATASAPRQDGHGTGWRRLGHLLLEASERPGWRVEVRGRPAFTTGPGEGLVVLPGTEHRLTMAGEGRASTWSLIDCRWSGGGDPLAGCQGAKRVPAAAMATVRRLLPAAAVDPGHHWAANLVATQARLELILALDLPYGAGARVDPRLARVLERLETGTDRPWSCTALARLAGLSLAHFHACFHRAMGTTPAAYVLGLRLRRAQGLLATTDLPVGTVADQCGFTCPFHFSRVFRANVGQSPRTYRQAQQP